MKNKKILAASLAAGLLLVTESSMALTPAENLGKKLFFDKKLSTPTGQSCAGCHLPSAGFADPDQFIPVSEGVIHGRFGGRNSPTASYAMYSPIFNFSLDAGSYVGGLFLDGRATGNELGDPLADQALAPFLNPVEMNNPNKRAVVKDALRSRYRRSFISQCGYVNLSSESEVDAAYDCIAKAIGEFERTEKFAAFNSKYDYYLNNCIRLGDKSASELADCATGVGKDAKKAGKKILSKDEWRGLQLFMKPNDNDGNLEKNEGAACVNCHVADWTVVSDYSNKVVSPSWAPRGAVPPVFTDFTYDNIGIPKSKHPLIAGNPVDLGLGGFLGDSNENGKFRVSTLRNASDTFPLGHNGFFDSLESITNFYNTRDVSDWDAPETTENLNTDEVGNLGLSKKDERRVAAFMKTLTDGYSRKTGYGDKDNEVSYESSPLLGLINYFYSRFSK